MKQKGDSIKTNKRRWSTQCALKLSLPQGYENAQTYVGPKSDWSNLWKQKTQTKPKIALRLLNTEMPLWLETTRDAIYRAQGGDGHLGKGFSTLALSLYPSLSTTVVTGPPIMACHALYWGTGKIRQESSRYLRVGSLQGHTDAVDLSLKGRGHWNRWCFDGTEGVRVRPSSCSWDWKVCLEMGWIFFSPSTSLGWPHWERGSALKLLQPVIRASLADCSAKKPRWMLKQEQEHVSKGHSQRTWDTIAISSCPCLWQLVKTHQNHMPPC